MSGCPWLRAYLVFFLVNFFGGFGPFMFTFFGGGGFCNISFFFLVLFILGVWSALGGFKLIIFWVCGFGFGFW